MADDPLLHAAGQISDGEHVDWGSISSSLPSDDRRAVADELAVLQQIAAGHRQLHQLLPVSSDTPPNLMPDRARWGHLDLLNIVGRGSYGTVYRAWDTRLERLVALKLFHGAPDPDAVMQEGRMLARIRHENVVTVYGADMIDGVAGLWMELVHGNTLEQLVKARGPLSAIEAATLGADVATALGAVHAAGLLHCDIKAQNVVQEPAGRIVLMDFGAGRVAPEARDSDQLSDVAGTPRYMAPELFEAGAVSTRSSDIYSFGVLLYYLVSARFPVDGKSLGELKRAQQANRVTPLNQVRAGLPAAFLDIVARTTARDPAQRPASAAAVESALSAIAAPTVYWKPRSIEWWAAVGAAVGLLALVLGRPFFTPAAPPAPEVRSIAVLPIKNLTGDPSKAYIADGLTEVLISNLARIRSLRVPSAAGVAPLRDSAEPPSEIAAKLGVQLLLAGSITQADSRVRLSVHVIGADGTALWGEEINREVPGVLAAQAEIAGHVAQRFNLDAAGLPDHTNHEATLDARAQDAYLRGLALANGGPSKAAESVRLFREAVEIEPRFAAAWAELAVAEGRFITSSVGIDRQSHAAFSRQMAEKAIELDPKLAIGHAALASELFYYEWDFQSAERSFRKALEVGPSDSFTRLRFSMFLAALGKTDEALALAEESRSIEPLNAARSHAVGIIHYYRRDYDRATKEMKRSLEISPSYPVPHFGLGRIYSALGRHDDAIAEIARALEGVRTSAYLVELARVYAAAGRPDDVKRTLAEVTDREKEGDAFNLDNLAYVAAAEGRVDDAFRILEDARKEKMANMLWIVVDPRVDSLRKDPRFGQLLQRMRLNP